MSAHTPGPWRVHQEVPGSTCYIQAGSMRNYIASASQKPDAILIAAAPEMAHVLLRLVAPFDGAAAAKLDLPVATITHDSQMLLDIRAALAKAGL